MSNPRDQYDESPFGDTLAKRALLVAENVVRRRCRGWNVAQHVRDDLRGEVVVRLLKRLRRAQEEPEIPPIHRFDEYIASVASRLVDDLARAVFPEWTRIKHRVLYLLNHDDRFRVFADAAGHTMCEPAHPSPARRRVHTSAARALASSVLEILGEAGQPLSVDDVVSALARRGGVVAANFSGPAELADRFDDPSVAMESADAVRRLWSEIEELPQRQRLALLLNARDEAGDSVLRLLAATDLAPIASLAAALGMSEDEMNELWEELPLPDDVIAGRLGLTRQQVINLRKAARDRLARRTSRAR
jgi:RNA polymerase sigma factor (sigma-70 family)